MWTVPSNHNLIVFFKRAMINDLITPNLNIFTLILGIFFTFLRYLHYTFLGFFYFLIFHIPSISADPSIYSIYNNIQRIPEIFHPKISGFMETLDHIFKLKIMPTHERLSASFQNLKKESNMNESKNNFILKPHILTSISM